MATTFTEGTAEKKGLPMVVPNTEVEAEVLPTTNPLQKTTKPSPPPSLALPLYFEICQA